MKLFKVTWDSGSGDRSLFAASKDLGTCWHFCVMDLDAKKIVKIELMGDCFVDDTCEWVDPDREI